MVSIHRLVSLGTATSSAITWTCPSRLFMGVDFKPMASISARSFDPGFHCAIP